ncbi:MULTISPECIES: hypothetical protein [unclassified Flavobacterium]|uniref:hypothetical protein n=1 Tax=unclassified Flavobacterium TaxID=196869 RepID=UPI0018E7E3A2|nr:hypothetical protein [Flavobacterium sp. IB48]MBJ2124535.1 hypothetical protein [Flavobacterium sp. IB48]
MITEKNTFYSKDSVSFRGAILFLFHLKLTGIFNRSELGLETELESNPEVFLLLNVEKEYRDYITAYLAEYIKNTYAKV